MCWDSGKFIGWVNGDPHFSESDIDLEGISDIAIIGNGNVALDVARLLLMPAGDLDTTDISSRALLRFSKSKVKRVHVFARRGLINVLETIFAIHHQFVVCLFDQGVPRASGLGH